MAIGQLPKRAKLASLLNFKVRVITTNSSQFIGTLLSFDKYMNLVLSGAEEFRLTRRSRIQLSEQKKQGKKVLDESGVKEDKRLLGLVVLRGEGIVSVVAEAAPSSGVGALKLNRGKGSVKPLKTLKSARPRTIGGGVTKPRR